MAELKYQDCVRKLPFFMAIGPEEDEKYTFSEPTAVVIPKGVPHCPIWTNKIEQPYLVMAVSLTGERND